MCFKKSFNTKKEAKKEVSKVKKTPIYYKGKIIKQARSAYLCNKCGKWHITSSK